MLNSLSAIVHARDFFCYEAFMYYKVQVFLSLMYIFIIYILSHIYTEIYYIKILYKNCSNKRERNFLCYRKNCVSRNSKQFFLILELNNFYVLVYSYATPS